QIAVAGRGSSMHELKAELAEYGDRIGVILSRSTLVGDYWCMEIVPAGVSKAKALAFLGERYGIGAERMISIGDNFNDLDMIEYAGLGVAMGNAPDGVRRAADLVAPDNDADGVAHVIDTCLL
ncbi:MAG: HAD-IIB family hydrolase, partial [Gemmatimonadota bacterium]|nr:HAD-IIB family hydrolase [Gemmatimonadota bacterium]